MEKRPTIELIDQLHFEIKAGQEKMMSVWEERIALFIKPRPWWIPPFIWKWLLNLVFIQSHKAESTFLGLKAGGEEKI